MNTEDREHSVEAYLRRQRTEVLRAILRADLEGSEEYTLDTIFLICKILAERDPPPRSTEEIFREFMLYYAPEIEDL